MRRGEELSVILGLLLAACGSQLGDGPAECTGDKCDDPTEDPVAEDETRVRFETRTVFRATRTVRRRATTRRSARPWAAR